MKIFKIIILLTVLICIGLFIRATDMEKVFSSLQNVGYKFTLLIGITFVAYLSATVGWRFCLGYTGKHLSIGGLFLIRHIGETIGQVNPTGIIGGEAVKMYLLKGRGIQGKPVLTSIMVARVLMILSQLMLFTVVLGFLLFQGMNVSIQFPHFPTFFFPAIFIVFTIIFLIIKSGYLKLLIDKTKAGLFLKKQCSFFLKKWHSLRAEIINFFRQSKKALALSFLFFLLHWIVGAFEFYVILRFLHVAVGVQDALLVDMGVIFFKSAGSFIPGQIGVEEYGNKVMLAFVGIHGEEIWITASILRRARQLFWISFALCAYFIIYGRWRNMAVPV